MWQIDHQCPQCRAPVTLEETERLFVCPLLQSTTLYLLGRHGCAVSCLRRATGGADRLRAITGAPKGLISSVSHKRGNHSTLSTAQLLRTACVMSSLIRWGVQLQVFKLAIRGPHGGTGATAGHHPTRGHRNHSDETDRVCRRHYRGFGVHSFSCRLARSGEYTLQSCQPGGRHALSTQSSGKNLGQRQDLRCQFGKRPLADQPEEKVSFIPCTMPGLRRRSGLGEKESITLYCGNCQQVFSIEGGFATEPRHCVRCRPAQDAIYLPFWFMEAQFEGLENAREPLSIEHGENRPHRCSARCVSTSHTSASGCPLSKLMPTLLLTLAERATAARPGNQRGDQPRRQKPTSIRSRCRHARGRKTRQGGDRSSHWQPDQRLIPDFVGMTVRPKEPRLGLVPVLIFPATNWSTRG